MRSDVAPPDTDPGTLPGKPQPRGDTQINGDEIVQDIRVSQKYA